MPKKLIDLEVEEISAVDKAANMRQFLIIKAAGEGTNPMGFETGALVGGPNKLAYEAWTAVLTRLNAIVAEDYSGRSREQILAQALKTDSTLKTLAANWERVMTSPTEGMVDAMAKSVVAKGAAGSYEVAYAQVLADNPGFYGQILQEQSGSGGKVAKGGVTLRDVVWSAIEKMGAAVKAQNPKLSKYEANAEAMKTPLGSYLATLEMDQDARLPVAHALEKIAKRTTAAEVEMYRVVKTMLS